MESLIENEDLSNNQDIEYPDLEKNSQKERTITDAELDLHDASGKIYSRILELQLYLEGGNVPEHEKPSIQAEIANGKKRLLEIQQELERFDNN